MRSTDHAPSTTLPIRMRLISSLPITSAHYDSRLLLCSKSHWREATCPIFCSTALLALVGFHMTDAKLSFCLQVRPAPSWQLLETSLAQSTKIGFLSSMLLMREEFRFGSESYCCCQPCLIFICPGGQRESEELCPTHCRRKAS